MKCPGSVDGRISIRGDEGSVPGGQICSPSIDMFIFGWNMDGFRWKIPWANGADAPFSLPISSFCWPAMYGEARHRGPWAATNDPQCLQPTPKATRNKPLATGCGLTAPDTLPARRKEQGKRRKETDADQVATTITSRTALMASKANVMRPWSSVTKSLRETSSDGST